MLDAFTAQVRTAAGDAGFLALTLPGRTIGASADGWEAFLKTTDWTALENAYRALVRRRNVLTHW